ncbi:cache domain-containing protein [Prauserella cavernicola]|uniref:PDC sensor domain-containing protein n=1 Tax=Prauserella cavernicola TaxID=2800127 RepID=A0A934QNM8_9PSEU|nr:cache domain-containing protein [Prauserella cavernicola]MBK1783226.1 PDC sensor domain-containing protein [Prauserella cavernicola]
MGRPAVTPTVEQPVQEASPYAGEAAATVEALLRETFAGTDELRGLAVDVHRRAVREGRAPTTEDLEAIRPTVLRLLSQSRVPLAGTGVIAAPGTLADRPRWLEWWRRSPSGGSPRPLAVDLDPGNIGSYEYPVAPWFDVPCRTGRRVVVGPYVDYAGTDEYILTFAAPVSGDAGFFGVAAADIRATDLERALLPVLNADGPASLIVNASGRVIASNTPATIVGSIVRPGQGERRELAHGDDWPDCTGLPWFLVRDPA